MGLCHSHGRCRVTNISGPGNSKFYSLVAWISGPRIASTSTWYYSEWLLPRTCMKTHILDNIRLCCRMNYKVVETLRVCAPVPCSGVTRRSHFAAGNLAISWVGCNELQYSSQNWATRGEWGRQFISFDAPLCSNVPSLFEWRALSFYLPQVSYLLSLPVHIFTLYISFFCECR